MPEPVAPPVLSFAGPSGAGKTTLLEGLLRTWSAQGWRVGAVKHAHHALRPRDPETDGARLRRAGAARVRVAASGEGWRAAVERLLSGAGTLDWIVLEGYHQAPVVQILVLPRWDALPGELARARGWIAGLVGPDAPPPPAALPAPVAGRPAWPRTALAEIARFVTRAVAPVEGSQPAGAPLRPPRPPGAAAVRGVVLAGGASRRMRRDKASIGEPGRTWLEIAATALGEATGSPALVTGREHASWPSTPDLVAGSGPLGGIVTAAYRLRSRWLLVAPCDMPSLTAAALRPLLDELRAANDAFDAVLPRVGGRLAPLPGLVRRESALAATAELAAGRAGLRAWIAGLRVREVGEEVWRLRGLDPERAFADVDDEEALRARRAQVPAGGTRRRGGARDGGV